MKITKTRLKQIIKEELEKVLTEKIDIETTKTTFRNRNMQVVNAWGGYIMDKTDKERIRNLIKVLKSFKIPKESAFKVLKAKTSEEVLAILNEVPHL